MSTGDQYVPTAIDRMADVLSERDTIIRDLRAELDRVRGEGMDAMDREEKAASRVADLEAQLAAATRKVQTVGDYAGKLNADLERVRYERDTLRAELQAAVARAEQAEDAHGEVERIARLARADLARVTGERDAAQAGVRAETCRANIATHEVTKYYDLLTKAESDLATARAEAEALKTRLHDANNALFVASAKKSMAEKSVRDLVAGLRECRMHAVGYAPESLVAKLDALLAKHANGGA